MTAAHYQRDGSPPGCGRISRSDIPDPAYPIEADWDASDEEIESAFRAARDRLPRWQVEDFFS